MAIDPAAFEESGGLCRHALHIEINKQAFKEEGDQPDSHPGEGMFFMAWHPVLEHHPVRAASVSLHRASAAVGEPLGCIEPFSLFGTDPLAAEQQFESLICAHQLVSD